MKKSINLLSLETLAPIMSAVFVFTIPLGIKFHNIVIGIFLVLCALGFRWNDVSIPRLRIQKISTLYFLQFFIIALGLLYTTNLEAGWNDLERAIYPIAIIPIIYWMRSSKESIYTLLLFFSISCIGIALFGILASWIDLKSTSFAEAFQLGPIRIGEYIGILPLYLSVFLILVLFFFLESYRTNHTSLILGRKWLLAGAILLVILIILYLRSKTGLLLLPTLLTIYLLIIQKRRGWFVVFVLMLIGLLTFLIDKNNSLGLIDQYGVVSKAFDQRLYIWKGAIEGIKTSPWIGAGTGDAQELLNAGYAKIGYQEGIDSQFNAHNQYLQFMARNGLIELLCFLAILTYSFWKSTKLSNYTFLMFNILVSLVMLTESFLSVQKGIVFFYFFLLAFVYLPEKKQDAPQI